MRPVTYILNIDDEMVAADKWLYSGVTLASLSYTTRRISNLPNFRQHHPWFVASGSGLMRLLRRIPDA